MQVLYKIHLKDGRKATGEKIRDAVKQVSETAEFKYELIFADDSGDYYLIGINSQHPDKSLAIITLPDKEAKISLERSYEDGEIAIQSYNFGGRSFASKVLPEAIRKYALSIREELEEILNS